MPQRLWPTAGRRTSAETYCTRGIRHENCARYTASNASIALELLTRTRAGRASSRKTLPIRAAVWKPSSDCTKVRHRLRREGDSRSNWRRSLTELIRHLLRVFGEPLSHRLDELVEAGMDPHEQLVLLSPLLAATDAEIEAFYVASGWSEPGPSAPPTY